MTTFFPTRFNEKGYESASSQNYYSHRMISKYKGFATFAVFMNVTHIVLGLTLLIWSLELLFNLVLLGEVVPPSGYTIFSTVTLGVFIVRLIFTLVWGCFNIQFGTCSRYEAPYSMIYGTMLGFDIIKCCLMATIAIICLSFPSSIPAVDAVHKLLSPWLSTTGYTWGNDVQWVASFYTFAFVQGGFIQLLSLYQLFYDLDVHIAGPPTETDNSSKGCIIYESGLKILKVRFYIVFIVFCVATLYHLACTIWLALPVHRRSDPLVVMSTLTGTFFVTTTTLWSIFLAAFLVLALMSIYKGFKTEVTPASVLRNKHFLLPLGTYLIIGCFCMGLLVAFYRSLPDPHVIATQRLSCIGQTNAVCPVDPYQTIATTHPGSSCSHLSAAAYYWNVPNTPDQQFSQCDHVSTLREWDDPMPHFIVHFNSLLLSYSILLPLAFFALFRFFDPVRPLSNTTSSPSAGSKLSGLSLRDKLRF